MDLDDLEPRKSADYEIGGDLTKLSVEELKGLIGKLRDEISRIEQALGVGRGRMGDDEEAFAVHYAILSPFGITPSPVRTGHPTAPLPPSGRPYRNPR